MEFQRSHIDSSACGSCVLEPYRCKDCGFESDCIVTINIHTKSFHKHLETKKWKSLKCDNCDFETFSVLVLARHTIICSTKKAKNFRYQYMVAEGIKWFLCDFCSFKSKYRICVKRHTLRNHHPKKKKWFDCEQCPYKTLKKCLIEKHFKLQHLQFGKRYFCEYCPSGFQQSSALKEHMVTKHTHPDCIDWLECEQCPFQTKTQRCLNIHVKQNHGVFVEPSIKCEFCSYKAKYVRTMRRHLNTVHAKDEDAKWFVCDKCPFRSKYKKSLGDHLLGVHTFYGIENL